MEKNYKKLDKKEKKIKFYDTLLKVFILGFIISVVSIFIVPESILNNLWFLIFWYLTFLIAGISAIIFNVGMVINAFKMKKYLWMIVLIFFGIIFPIIFYFSVMRKNLKKEE